MTEMDHRIVRRAIAEDPHADHDAQIGTEVVIDDWLNVGGDQAVQRFNLLGDTAMTEETHPHNLLAQKHAVPRPLALTVDLDAIEDPAVRARFEAAEESSEDEQ
ncbi:hypothetical protein [Kineococcus radiotolerans]|uniref:Uncharacterized protein n=1 Tax=Kineococcus radiotolerans (strain ATCC BAA-149 / DSM 14245 / SRS30216) TaxID=266940 RepID=A6W8U4_KINRD|nr:hypothetical protein [Kineococcus radiotolerans]ABS03233.1 hypothetical protein Krad_1747 [Kineococcus radiotolerans SRS30216 = ATCC BAA-149]